MVPRDAGRVLGVVLEDGEGVPIAARQSILGGEPEIALPVLQNVLHHALGQAVVDGDAGQVVAHLPLDRLTERWRCEQEQQTDGGCVDHGAAVKLVARVLPRHISLEPTIDAAAIFALFCGVAGATLINTPEPRRT